MNRRTQTEHQQPAGQQSPIVLLNESEVCRRANITRSTLRVMVNRGYGCRAPEELVAAAAAPAPLCLGGLRKDGKPCRIAWVEAEVDAWLRALAATRLYWHPASEAVGAEA